MTEDIEFDSLESFERWLEREQEAAAAQAQTLDGIPGELGKPTDDQIAIWKALAGGMIFGP